MLCSASRSSRRVTSAGTTGAGGGGGVSTVTVVVAEAARGGLRSSFTVHVTVMEPGGAPAVFNVAFAEVLQISPAVAV